MFKPNLLLCVQSSLLILVRSLDHMCPLIRVQIYIVLSVQNYVTEGFPWRGEWRASAANEESPCAESPAFQIQGFVYITVYCSKIWILMGCLCLCMNYIVSNWVSRVWQIHFDLLSMFIKDKSLGFSRFCCKYIKESHIKAGDDCQHLFPNYLFLNPLPWSVQIVAEYYWSAVSLWPSFESSVLELSLNCKSWLYSFLVADNWDQEQEHPRVTICLR